MWGVPAIIATAAGEANQASLLSVAETGWLWTLSVTWAGVGCIANGRSCGRVHCKIDGVAFPLLGLAAALNTLSVITFSWSSFWLVFIIILVGSFVPELVWKKYI